MKRMFGESFFLARPLKFTDCDEFIKELKMQEVIAGRKAEPSKFTVRTSRRISGFREGWTCDVCDGDSSTGCLASDPDICPMH